MYKKLWAPKHPRADLTGFVSLHIVVAEAMLERPIRKGEIVHHQDFDKGHNDPKNFTICTREEHQQIPAAQALYLHEKGLYDDYKAWWEENRKRVPLLIRAQQRLIELEEGRAIKELRIRLGMRRNEVRYGTTGSCGPDELACCIDKFNARHLSGLSEEVLLRVQEIIDANQDPGVLHLGKIRSHGDRVPDEGEGS